jgi:tubulin--tyrosine ligase
MRDDPAATPPITPRVASELSTLFFLFRATAPPPLPAAVVRVDCPYTQRHLDAIFARRASSWRVLPPSAPASLLASAPLVWAEYEAIDWGAAMSPPYRMVPSFCIRKGLCRKANLAEAVAAYAARHPASPLAAAAPATVVIDTYGAFHARPGWLDLRSALAEALCEAEAAVEGAPPGAAWVLKPSLTNKGAGLSLLAGAAALAAAVRAEPDVGQWVLQRYVAPPLLLLGGRHKFHVRLYVAAVGALRVHVFREALLLLAPEPFTEDLAAVAAHVTNTCVGAASPLFSEEAHVRCLSELPALLGGGAGAGAAAAGLFAAICGVTAHAFAAQEGRVAGFMPLPLGWELYGVDFLVDAAMRPWLLEFNPTPDIRQSGARLDGIIGAMLEGLVQLAVDRRVRRVVPPGGGGGAGVLQPDARAPGVEVEVEVGASGCGVVGALPAWRPGCSGAPLPASAAVEPLPLEGSAWDASGWDCVYEKHWPSAHGAMGVRVQ